MSTPPLPREFSPDILEADILEEAAREIRTHCADDSWGDWGAVPDEEVPAHAFDNLFEDALSYILYDVYGFESEDVNDEGGEVLGVIRRIRIFTDYTVHEMRTHPHWFPPAKVAGSLEIKSKHLRNTAKK